MNNWRLLLLAVVAVLQPIGSFTEPNFIDGRQECCNHRSNSITQDTRFYGNYRKITPEERRLNSREDIREERYEARNDPITRSRERLTLERAESRISFGPTVRFTSENRFERGQERRNHISVEARKSRHSREEQNRRTRESSGDSLIQFERDVLDSRRIRMSRDHSRTGRVGNKRLHRASLDSRDARRIRHSEVLRRVSVNKETMAVLSRERDDVGHDVVRRDSRVSAFRSVTRLQLHNNRERRTLDRRARDTADENRRTRSLDSRVNSFNERDGLRSRTNPREDLRNNFRAIAERVDERRQLDKTSAILRDSSEKRESRDIQRVDRTRRTIRENLINERIDERRQLRDESRLSRERMILRESNYGTSAEQRQTRESSNFQFARNVRSNDRIDERRESSKDVLRTTRDSTTERRHESRLSRMLEVTTHNERLVRDDERRDVRKQLSTRSPVSELRLSQESRSTDRENNFRNSAQYPERNVREERAARYRRDVRSVERLDERRQQRGESRMSWDRSLSMLRESRDSAEPKQVSRASKSHSRFEVKTRSERESRIRDNVRFDVNRREREQRKAFREQTLHLMARDNERRHDRELYRTTRFVERASPNERVSIIREDVSSERIDVQPKIRDENRASRGRTVVIIRRLTRDVSAPQQRYDIRRTSRNDAMNARIQRTRTLEDIRDERREVRERVENRASRDRISMTGLSVEDHGRESRPNTRNSRVTARNEVTPNRGAVPKSENFEVHRKQGGRRSQYHVSLQQTRDILAARSVERRSRELTSRDTVIDIRSERLSKSRDDRRVNGREIRTNRDFTAKESRRESRKMTEREVQPNRHNLAMERMGRTSTRASRDVRIEAKLRSSDIILDKDVRINTRLESTDTRFKNSESKFREINVDETSDNQNALNWQMICYTLQGAYLCGLLMQMLTEQPYKGKSRNFKWWSSTYKDLVKVN